MSSSAISNSRHVLLADDDQDDCLLFSDALEELSFSVRLTIVHNGEQLMEFLLENEKDGDLPDILFLDLNMPRKNGFECLSEIKRHEKLKQLPVTIFSTSFEQEMMDELNRQGAQNCFRKPNEFSKLKEIIQHALTLSDSFRADGANGDFIKSSKEGLMP